MRGPRSTITASAVLLVLSSACASSRYDTTQAATLESASYPSFPVATTSPVAREALLAGQRKVDFGDGDGARADFQRAVAADSTSALAWLRLATGAMSVGEFRVNLERAERYAASASAVERLLIEMERAGFNGNIERQLELGQQLVRADERNPRTWMRLSGAQHAAGKVSEGRASLGRALGLAGTFAPVHYALANSYMFSVPKDATEALKHARHGVDLAPGEPLSYDLLGDAYRANNQLTDAAAAYTKQIELRPNLPDGYQQRGHVQSILGNYAAARADYDAAVVRAEPNARPGFGVFRALVWVHEGQPDSAIAEFERHLASIDQSGAANAAGQKLGALGNIAQIALYHGRLDVARRAAERAAPLRAQFAAEAQNDQVRRGQEANGAYWDSMLATFSGQFDVGREKAREYMRLVSTFQDPRRDEPGHELLAMADLRQGNHAAAVAHFDQADPNDVGVMYYRALALEGSGRTAEAKALFDQVARSNFNNVTFALVRRDAQMKAR